MAAARSAFPAWSARTPEDRAEICLAIGLGLQARAEELAVRLVMPLGLCLLPAFVCWGVVPVVMALLGAGPG